MEYRDVEQCSTCGGRCCAIYLPVEDGGMFPAGWYGFDEWVEGWLEHFMESGALNCGVQPLHDPLVLHMAHHFEARCGMKCVPGVATLSTVSSGTAMLVACFPGSAARGSAGSTGALSGPEKLKPDIPGGMLCVFCIP